MILVFDVRYTYIQCKHFHTVLVDDYQICLVNKISGVRHLAIINKTIMNMGQIWKPLHVCTDNITVTDQCTKCRYLIM